MYLHLGSDFVITFDNIVAVCDIDRATVSKDTKDFLSSAEKKGELTNLSTDLPKSFVVCSKSKKQNVFITQISPQTLLKRTVQNRGDTV
mgnify:CR=1 FL=1